MRLRHRHDVRVLHGEVRLEARAGREGRAVDRRPRGQDHLEALRGDALGFLGCGFWALTDSTCFRVSCLPFFFRMFCRIKMISMFMDCYFLRYLPTLKSLRND